MARRDALDEKGSVLPLEAQAEEEIGRDIQVINDNTHMLETQPQSIPGPMQSLPRRRSVA